MNLKNLIAVSGAPGLYEMVSSKNSGLILKDPKTKKSKFYSVRQHQFTPLETVGIYTMTDTVDLKVIFGDMTSKIKELPIPSPKDQNKDLLAYFAIILPEFDRDRVYPSDIKKIIKWYNFVDEMGYLAMEEEVEENASQEEE